jgi:hypothetical protein
MSFHINLNCIPTKTDENNDLKIVINNHAKTILELNMELETYKNFYNKIINHNVISDKFEEYNKTINDLKKENYELKEIINKLK